jgi:hypothetical protein
MENNIIYLLTSKGKIIIYNFNTSQTKIVNSKIDANISLGTFNYIRDYDGGYLLFQSEKSQYFFWIDKDGNLTNWYKARDNYMNSYHTFNFVTHDRFFTFNGQKLEICYFSSKPIMTTINKLNKENNFISESKF